jgi:hypothetical protein
MVQALLAFAKSSANKQSALVCGFTLFPGHPAARKICAFKTLFDSENNILNFSFTGKENEKSNIVKIYQVQCLKNSS